MRKVMTHDAAVGPDERFIERCRRTTLGLGAFLTIWLCQTLDAALIGGFASGVLVGAGLLAGTAAIVRFAMPEPGAAARRGLAAALALAKLGVAFLVLRLALVGLGFSAAALAAGFTLVLAVIVLKTVGRELARATGAGA
jgi:hypothetical protein